MKRHNFCLNLSFLLWCFLVLASGSETSAHLIHLPDVVDNVPDTSRHILTPIQKIDALADQARAIPHADSAQAMILWRQALQEAKKTGNKLDEAKTYLNIGSWHYDHYRTKEAQYYNELVLQSVQQDSSREARILLAKSQINMANISWQRNQIEEALKGYLSVLPMLAKLDDTESLALANTNIAILFSNQEQYHKSNFYFSESISQYKHLQPIRHPELADDYLMLSMNMLNTKDSTTAKVGKLLDSAFLHLHYLDKQHRLWADYYSIQGRYQLKKGRLSQAEQSFRKGLQIARRYNDTYTSSDILLYLSELYERRGSYEKTRPLLDELLNISQSNQVGSYQMKALRALSRMEHRLKNPEEAYRYLNAYINLSDSLHAEEITSKLHEMEERYKVSETQNKLLLLQRENEQKDFSLERNRLYIGLLIGISIPLLISCILVFLLYRNKKKLLKQQQSMHAMDVERIQHRHKNSLLSALLEGQEKERERLARDLHDGLGGILSSIKMDLSSISCNLPNDIPQKKDLHLVVQHLDRAVEELRGIAHSMMPSILVNYGLAEALRTYCDQLKHAPDTSIFFQAFRYDNRMEPARQMLLYRIAQELVNNGIKHAGAKELLVQLQQQDDTIMLTVEDDGKGFDTTRSYDGAGLRNVAMRVDLLNGTLDIHSEKGIGTTFTIECPVTLKHSFPDEAVLHR